jgi:hypothetical protein
MEMISTFTSGALFFTNLGNHESDSPKSASFYDGTDSGTHHDTSTSIHLLANIVVFSIVNNMIFLLY